MIAVMLNAELFLTIQTLDGATRLINNLQLMGVYQLRNP